jgi:hypothetical protein
MDSSNAVIDISVCHPEAGALCPPKDLCNLRELHTSAAMKIQN